MCGVVGVAAHSAFDYWYQSVIVGSSIELPLAKRTRYFKGAIRYLQICYRNLEHPHLTETKRVQKLLKGNCMAI
jgi:hypothetical protein